MVQFYNLKYVDHWLIINLMEKGIHKWLKAMQSVKHLIMKSLAQLISLN